MKKLLEETIEILEENNKKLSDLEFGIIGNDNPYMDTNGEEKYFSIEDYEIFAKKTTYDSSYGGNEVNMSLKLVGKDFWLERHEYDGSEWFEFKTMPVKPVNKTEDLSSIIN